MGSTSAKTTGNPIERFRSNADRYIGSRIVLACSGGGDSIALAELFAEAYPDEKSRILIAHFDHRMRPGSHLDADWVRERATSLGFQCEVGIWHEQPSERPSEADARAARYEFLSCVATKFGASIIATAHTRDDVVETVLFRLFRGTGLKGVTGIPRSRPLSQKISLVRPLLDFSREELRDYLKARDRDWREDESNITLDRKRNWIRNLLLPLLRVECNPRVDDAIVRFAEQAESVSIVLDEWADRILAAVDIRPGSNEVGLPLDLFGDLDPAQRRLILHRVFVRVGWPMREIDAAALDRIGQCCNPGGPKACDLPAGIRVERHATSIMIRRSTTDLDSHRHAK